MVKKETIKIYSNSLRPCINDYVKLYHAKNYKKVKFCTISHGTAFLNLNYNIRSFERKISHKFLVQNPSS